MNKPRATHKEELLVPSTGTRIPIPDDATDDDIDELVISHPELVSRAERARRDRVRKPAANGTTSGRGARAPIAEETARR